MLRRTYFTYILKEDSRIQKELKNHLTNYLLISLDYAI